MFDKLANFGMRWLEIVYEDLFDCDSYFNSVLIS